MAAVAAIKALVSKALDLGPRGELAPLRAPHLAATAAAFVVAAMVLGSVQAASPHLLATDGHYHTRVAALIAERGLLQDFPWAQASLYRDHYVDTEVLFHLLLVPFLGEELTLGPKLLTVALGALVLALLTFTVLRLGAPWPWLWPALVLTAGVAFTFRMSLTRPELGSLLLLFPFLLALLRRSAPALFLLSVLYPLSYAASHLFPGLAVLYALACALRRQPLPWRLLAVVAAGTLAGLLLHPNRESYALVWWAINVGDLTSGHLLEGQLAREFQPAFGTGLVWGTGLILPVLVFATGAALRAHARLSVRTVFLFLVTAGFFVLYLRHQRFVVYWVPLGALFAASAARDTGAFGLPAWAARHRRVAAAALTLFVLALLGQSAFSLDASQRALAAVKSPRYREAALWLAENVPAGQTVFTGTWDSTPFLLHRAPQAHYLNVLSPNLMLAWDAEAFALWRRIAAGAAPDGLDQTADRFGARWILVEKDRLGGGLLRQAHSEPRLYVAYEDGEAAIFGWR